MFESILNPIFKPLLILHPFMVLFLLSLIITIFVTLIYKYTTNQKEMKQLKEDMKKHQKEMKENKHDHVKVMEIQKLAMEKNMKYMMKSFKPMLFTFIPLIIIFGWMHANIEFQPISPGEEFQVYATFTHDAQGIITLNTPDNITLIGNASKQIDSDKNNRVYWTLKGNSGKYEIEYEYKNKKYYQNIIIANKKCKIINGEIDSNKCKIEQTYLPKITKINENGLNTLEINYDKLRPLGQNINIPLINNWLGIYIVLSLIFSSVLRKVMKVY